jgi:D-apionolactonase
MLPLNAIRWGHDAPQPERRELRAGPLTMLFESGDLRYIRLGDREVLRRVYVAVRDHNWDTIPIAISGLSIEQRGTSFTITFQADHCQGEIGFGWRGTVTGDAQGTVTFAMDGAARTAFLRNRIGFCILHPPDGCAGHSCVVEHDDGTRVTDEFPYHIAPSQPFVEMRAIAHEVEPGTWAEVRFAGDIFEMEDQRNWTDASYKTYCTPLRLPYPAPIVAGETVAQAVTLSLTGGEKREGRRANEASAPVVVTVGDEPLGPLPCLGLGVASHGQPLSETEIARLRALNLAHLRVDLHLAEPGWRDRLAQAVAEAQALSASLEAALTLTTDAEAELTALTGALTKLQPPVIRFLVYHAAEKVTSERWTALARRILKLAAPTASISGGTDAYFTELNRDRPALDPLDLVAYSINPQVHAFDDASLVETLPMQTATVESTRQFVGDTPISISPITLLPRFNPNATGPYVAPDPTQLPVQVDPRQSSLFAAAWTVGSLAALAAARVASATYYETTGPRGVMETASGSPWPAFHSLPGTVFPVYHILATVGELRDGDALPVTTSDPLRAAALAIRHQGQTRILLANLLPESQPITLHVNSDRATVRHLDETTAIGAMQLPDEFRALTGTEHAVAAGALSLQLLPYAVAEITLEA